MKRTLIIALALLALLTVCAYASQAEQNAVECAHVWSSVDSMSHVCELCQTPAKHELSPKTTKPTCLSVGYTMDTCADCGYAGAQYDIRPVEETAHAWNSWIMEKESTCTVRGSRSHSCRLCGKVKTEELPLAEHQWKSETVAPSCKADGYTVKVCSVCKTQGEKTDIVPRSAAYHHWGEFKVTAQAGCEKAGSQTRVCSVCGASHKQDIPAMGHQMEKITVPVGICEDGYTVKKCSRCGKEAGERTNIVPAGHKWDEWKTVEEPLCLSDGVQKRVCTACKMEETRTLPATGHNFKEGTRQPTCQSDGYTAVVCVICGVMDGEPYDIVSADPDYHVWDEDRWEREAEPTCTEWGLYWQGCKYCEYMKRVQVPPNGHASVETTVEQGFAQDGYKVLLCTLCGCEDGPRYGIVPAGMYSMPMQETQVSDHEFSGVESAVLYTAVSDSGETAAVLAVRADASGMVEMDFSEKWYAENHVVRVVIVYGDVKLTALAEGMLHVEIASETAAEGLLVSVLTNLPTDGFDETCGEYEGGVYRAALPESGDARFNGRCISLSTPEGPGTLLVVSTAAQEE